MALKRLILREVARQDGDPRFVAVRSTRSPIVRRIERRLGRQREGQTQEPVRTVNDESDAPTGPLNSPRPDQACRPRVTAPL